jgi:hypothetical protein
MEILKIQNEDDNMEMKILHENVIFG